ncbi:MAG: alpha/beta hydrolase fold domain-containing protein [Rhizobiaceae bacterium]
MSVADRDASTFADARRSAEMEALWREIRARSAPLAGYADRPFGEERAFRNHLSTFCNDDMPPVQAISETYIRLESRSVPIEIVTPAEPRAGCILFLHGGGWVAGNLRTHARMARVLANCTRFTVVSAEYRLAPEHPYPCGLDDAEACWRWLAGGGSGLVDRSGAIGVAGDSAGANLALALLLKSASVSAARADFGLLFYGVFSEAFDSPSCRAFGDGRFGLSVTALKRYRDMYLPEAADRGDMLANPLLAGDEHLRELPPLCLVGAALDPLLCDTLILADRLRRLGREPVLCVGPGMHHGFMQWSGRLKAADAAFETAGRFASAIAEGASPSRGRTGGPSVSPG